jgi:4-hydroxy-3-methylbut-2-enyl diphosphate reductase
MAVAPSSVRLIQHPSDVDALEDLVENASPVALLAQTTLSHDEWRNLMELAKDKFPDLWMPNRSDLCFATTNRQAALKAIAGAADAVVVIGSSNSSNTVALEMVAKSSGCTRVYRVNDAAELPDDLSGTVAITAGASAPEQLVSAVIDRLSPTRGVEVASVTTEDEYFPPPPELRELLRGLGTVLGCFHDADNGDPRDPVAGDRSRKAATVLSSLIA